jgi:PncC family amidohydrolase
VARGAAQELAFEIVPLLVDRGRTIAVAESCTGGLIGHLLTNVPGSSRCFIGGVAAYNARAKATLLGVAAGTMRDHGAVSAETATAMALGVRERLDADIGIGVTGIAGPGGGSEDKPVGTVYIAVATRDGRGEALREHFEGGREEYKEQAARRALELLREYLD